MTDQAPELLPKIEVTELHKQSAAGFLCWPMNIIDLCKSDADLPRAVDALAKFIARWERKGAEATRPPSERPVAQVREALERADAYLQTIQNRGNCGPHHLVSDLTAELRALASLSPLKE